MAKPIKIDFVSDIACPWCAIGLKSLQEALARLEGDVTADVQFRPYELHPDMAAEGESLNVILTRKYGAVPEQMAASRIALRQRATEVGFVIPEREDSQVYNTFDAHRLLHWAHETGQSTETQIALKLALFEAYFTRGENVADHAVLLQVVELVGLNQDDARRVLKSDAYALNIRAEETLWQSRGINSVPSIIVNEKYLISGGQSAEVFEQTLRSIAAELPEA